MKSLSLLIVLPALALRAFAAECAGHDHQPASEHVRRHAHEPVDEHEHEHEPACEHDHEHEHAGGGEAIKIDPGLAETIGLSVATASVTRIGEECVFHAYGEIDPDARRTIAAAAPGLVEFAASSLADVESGAELLTIRSPELIDLQRAIAALESRQAVYRQLGTANAALATELDRLRSQFETLSGGRPVKDGVIVERAAAAGRFRRLVAAGTKVERGEAVGELTAAGRLRFGATLAAEAVKTLRDGEQALDDDGNAFTVRRESAASRGMVELVLIPPAKLALPRDWVGRRRRFRRQVPAAEDGAVAVPAAAIVDSQGAHFVFVRDRHDSDLYLKRRVVPGESAHGLTVVKGVDANETVVCAGARQLAIVAGGGKASAAGHFHADGKFHAGDD